MKYDVLHKLLEIQYLKGRLDELYKGYVPHSLGHDERVVDSRISKYEDKLKRTDEIAFHLYCVERENRQWSKKKGKAYIAGLLSSIKDRFIELDDKVLIDEIDRQLKRYEI